MTVEVIHNLNTVTTKFSEVSPGMKKNIEPVFKKFVLDIFSDIVFRSPVDKGAYRADWDLKQSYSDNSLVMTISNNMPYAGVLEAGSPVGKKPWPSEGPKTIEKDDRIWSKQMSEPVAGEAVKSADWEGLQKQISRTLDGVL